MSVPNGCRNGNSLDCSTGVRSTEHSVQTKPLRLNELVGWRLTADLCPLTSRVRRCNSQSNLAGLGAVGRRNQLVSCFRFETERRMQGVGAGGGKGCRLRILKFVLGYFRIRVLRGAGDRRFTTSLKLAFLSSPPRCFSRSSSCCLLPPSLSSRLDATADHPP
ncbi:hypothetical protein CISG_01531 [Coccidioides immitis RMSCC 3703]|uniref:Uncharacterized protein n=2 Tax=Coccidioides immitis TaxID=5501 RepID=A0A0J8R0B5_COCIT|nr:hypothetical protein CIRG_04926 [Coccidioides immitis RMSCC 2394]KMU77775.1 hypothetical protein CISG_01531 [Coccidioides immitis RMSCC 3703]